MSQLRTDVLARLTHREVRGTRYGPLSEGGGSRCLTFEPANPQSFERHLTLRRSNLCGLWNLDEFAGPDILNKAIDWNSAWHQRMISDAPYIVNELPSWDCESQPIDKLPSVGSG